MSLHQVPSKKKLENSHTKELKVCWKAPEKEKRRKHTQGEQTIGNNKLRAKINQLETKKTKQRIKKTKSWFFEKINKIDKALAKLHKRQRQYPN